MFTVDNIRLLFLNTTKSAKVFLNYIVRSMSAHCPEPLPTRPVCQHHLLLCLLSHSLTTGSRDHYCVNVPSPCCSCPGWLGHSEVVYGQEGPTTHSWGQCVINKPSLQPSKRVVILNNSSHLAVLTTQHSMGKASTTEAWSVHFTWTYLHTHVDLYLDS